MLGIRCQDFDILLNFVLVYTPFKERKRAQVNIRFLTKFTYTVKNMGDVLYLYIELVPKQTF